MIVQLRRLIVYSTNSTSRHRPGDSILYYSEIHNVIWTLPKCVRVCDVEPLQVGQVVGDEHVGGQGGYASVAHVQHLV